MWFDQLFFLGCGSGGILEVGLDLLLRGKNLAGEYIFYFH